MKSTSSKSFILSTLILLIHCTSTPKSGEEAGAVDSVGLNSAEASIQPGNENTRNPEEIRIGDQVWASANLDVSTFANGEAIPKASTDEEWARAGAEKRPVWCYSDFDPAKGKHYGKLYNRHAVSDPRSLAPAGWHIPSDSEWIVLTTYLGGELNEEHSTAMGTRLRENPAGPKMMSGSWGDSDFGDSESGFKALAGRTKSHTGGFAGIGESANWWSTADSVFGFSQSGIAEIRGMTEFVHYSNAQLNAGYSVRCLKGEAPTHKNSYRIGLSEKMPGKLLHSKIWQEGAISYKTSLSVEKSTEKEFGGLYAYHWKVAQNKPEFQWAYMDTLSCGMEDLVISNDLDSLIIEDTDNDQLKEIILIYTLSCTTDVSAEPRYLVVLSKEGKIKLKLKGWSKEPGGPGFDTDKKPEDRIENHELLDKLTPGTKKRLLELWAALY